MLALWLFLPDEWLTQVGVTYIVNREYAISIPIILVLTVIYGIVIYEGVNIIHTKPLSSYNTIQGTVLGLLAVDEYSNELNAATMKEAEESGLAFY